MQTFLPLATTEVCITSLSAKHERLTAESLLMVERVQLVFKFSKSICTLSLLLSTFLEPDINVTWDFWCLPPKKNALEVLLEIKSWRIRTKSSKKEWLPPGTVRHIATQVHLTSTYFAAIRPLHTALMQAPENWIFLHSEVYHMPPPSLLDSRLKW